LLKRKHWKYQVPGIFERTARFEIDGDPCSTEGVAADFGQQACPGRTTLLETLAS
jgi:hypothetical protein